ncbi:MAG: NifB/NifX family molybdenum-iron cluster-binding protein [Candidatus Delongbacteria bacterium]|nr:NifB/NifX family molybdenum-iron cluster-binding protein [Candidatus Delongbacteria bacterium]
MKIAFTTTGNGWDSEMDPRFGRAKYFVILDEDSGKLESIDNSSVSEHAHGAGPMTAQLIIEKNVNILITGNGAGGNAARVLEAAGIRSFIGATNMTAKEAYEAYKEGKLQN